MLDDWCLMFNSRRSLDVWENFEPTKTLGYKGTPHLYLEAIPDFHENISLGLPNNGQRFTTPKIAAARINLIKYCENWRDVNHQRSCSKDRYSRRTQSQRKHSLMQCILMFCIVLQSYVYLYTQFQNPPYLVNCWISLKFTGKTIKNFHLQWDSNPPNVSLLGKIRNLVSRSRTPKRATLLLFKVS